MFFYQPIPSIPELFIVRVSDSCAVRSDDTQWKLTDSSSFTNFRKADSLVVRMNGAESAQDTTTQVSVSDSLLIGLTDTTSSLSSSAVASDSVACIASDVFSGSQAFSLTDSCTSGLTDTVTVITSVSVSDSLAVVCSDVISQLSAVITASDSLAVQATEVFSSLISSVAASDSIRVSATDTFTGSQSFSTAESLAVQFSESLTASVSVSVVDSLTLQLSDVGALSQVTISASDSLSIGLSDVGGVVQNTLLSVTDSCVIAQTDLSAVTVVVTTIDSLAIRCTDTFTGSQALGVSEDMGFLLSEDQFSSLLVGASDSFLTALSEAPSVLIDLTISESLALQFSELSAKQDAESAIPKSASDSVAVSVEEGAVTELAGPYWAGSTHEDHAPIYADSYAMGPRDNPGRMRW